MQQTVIGLDPEFFVVNNTGQLICPKIFSEASKQFIPSDSHHGGFNRDGMAIELNPNPDSNPRELAKKMRYLMLEASRRLRDHGASPIEKIGANIFEEADTKTFAEDIRLGGCDPDYNAYSQSLNQTAVDYNTYPYRFCGGHIHVSAPFIRNFEEACLFIRNLRPLGEYLESFEDSKWSKARREVYGREGDFRWRQDKQRIEYRTPDASWIWAELKATNVMEEIFKIIDNTITKFTTVGG